MLAEIESIGVLPVVTLNDASSAGLLGQALAAGGVRVAEITLRTPAALAAIAAMAEACPDVLVGAGTVVHAGQVRQAVAAGARFVVSPGFSGDVVDACQDAGVPVFPGICTPTELMAAMSRGLPAVKFFPAENYGGVATLRALAAPFPDMRFIPTGGIDAARLPQYLALPNVAAVGGSWMVAPQLVAAGQYERIAALAREAVQAVAAARAQS